MESSSVRFTNVDGINIDSEWEGLGVTAQFLDNAELYDHRYFKSSYWTYLVERGLSMAGVDRPSITRVLDVGSGSGNTVMPALEFLPNASIVASDISPQLLAILRRHLFNSQHSARDVSLYCFDLQKDAFDAQSFDLVIGGAVLHHMLDPAAALRNIAKWIRRGGHIVLYEPLDYGAHIFATLFQLLVDELAESTDANDQMCVSAFNAFKDDIHARLGVPSVKPWTAALDDKWYFNLNYLRTLGLQLGLKGPRVFPLSNDCERYFNENILGLLSALGQSNLRIKSNAQSIIDQFDQGITSSLKRLFLLEGIVVFTK